MGGKEGKNCLQRGIACSSSSAQKTVLTVNIHKKFFLNDCLMMGFGLGSRSMLFM